MTLMYAKDFKLMATCVGAYDDSGVGTGGFIFVQDGNVTTVDKLDSTGLFVHDGAVYRFIRQMKAIVGYSSTGLHSFLRVPGTKDVHDLRLTSDGFVCVSTGLNEISWFTTLGQKTKTWHADGTNDAWHLNCIEEVDGRLYASAFGEFKTHREWMGKASKSGFILDIETGQKIITGLTGPHNPRHFDGKWFVCESHLRTLTVISPTGDIHRIQLDGFTRGLAYNEQFIFVGESANRKAETVPDFSHIVVLDRKTFEVIDRVQIPFPEIYEIVIVPDMIQITQESLTAFQFKFDDARIAFLEQQVDRLRVELLALQDSKSMKSNTQSKFQKLKARFGRVK